jgi:UDP-N-acetylglucosamine acyltransferase
MNKDLIHPTAIIDSSAEIGKGTSIGPYVVIEKDVTLGENNKVEARAHIAQGTTLGNENHIHMGAIIGHTPQDIAYKNFQSFTKIGDRNIIREYVTIHRGTQENSSTIIGNDNFFMAYSHIAHNCKVGNRVILVNNASLTGHCEVEDGAFLSGFVGLHQYSKIGTLAIISALSAINKDIPPFMMAGGRPATVQGLNSVGMKRAGFSPDIRKEIKEAYKLLYKSGLNTAQAVKKIKETLKSPQIKILTDFIEASDRGIAAGLGEETETLLTKKGSRKPKSDEIL